MMNEFIVKGFKSVPTRCLLKYSFIRVFGSLASVQEQRLPNAAASIDAEETPPITPTSAQHSKVMLHLPRSLARSLTFISFSLSVSIYLSIFLSSYISNYWVSSLCFSFLFLSVSLSLIYLLIYLFICPYPCYSRPNLDPRSTFLSAVSVPVVLPDAWQVSWNLPRSSSSLSRFENLLPPSEKE